MALHVLCAKKTKSVVKMRSKNTFLKALILSFLHKAQEMSFDSETLHECEQLIYVCPQICSDFFIMFYYFFNFFENIRSM